MCFIYDKHQEMALVSNSFEFKIALVQCGHVLSLFGQLGWILKPTMFIRKFSSSSSP